jgi:hypothetical protein
MMWYRRPKQLAASLTDEQLKRLRAQVCPIIYGGGIVGMRRVVTLAKYIDAEFIKRHKA